VSPAVGSRVAALQDFVTKSNNQKIDPEIAAYLFKLGAVIACGTIERCLEIIILDHLDKRAHPRVVSFLRTYFKRGTNYDCEEIEQLLGRFDTAWADAFKKFVLQNAGIKEAVSSCYSVRNSVAHGGAQTMGGKTLRKYSEKIILLIEAIELITSARA
jgi:hypothetical protein